MPTIIEARDKISELGKRGLEIVNDSKLTPAEQKTALDKVDVDLDKWTKELGDLEHVEAKRKEFLGSQVDDDAARDEKDPKGKSIGEQFTASDAYKTLITRGLKGNWTSGDIEIKALLTEGTVGAPGGAGALVQNPMILPGILPINFYALTVADLFAQGTTSSPLIRYMVETAATNAAAAVAEGALKPESALTFSKVDETLHKLATFLPVTDETLEDWAQAQSYINARLQLFVKQTEEAQLVSGDGTGANLVGLLNRPGLADPITQGTAPSGADDNAMDAIYRQITAIRTTAFIEPDAIVIDPVSWENVLLSKNAQGAYYANGPFVGAQPATLWGKRVVVTPAMGENLAVVGAFQTGGQIFRKGGLTVEASNSHADFFQRNQTAIRAEERLGLAVYRPAAFGEVVFAEAGA